MLVLKYKYSNYRHIASVVLDLTTIQQKQILTWHQSKPMQTNICVRKLLETGTYGVLEERWALEGRIISNSDREIFQHPSKNDDSIVTGLYMGRHDQRRPIIEQSFPSLLIVKH